MSCFYATSNRRHLMPRDMIENERSTAINPAEAVEEKVSLSDRFGLWLGFHNCRPGHLPRDRARLCRALRAAICRPSSCGPRPSNGRSPAARARAASPGSSSRTSPAARQAARLIEAARLSRSGAGATCRSALGAGQESRIDRLLAAAQFEMQLRLADPAGGADLGDHLAALDRVALLDEQLVAMGIGRDPSRWRA